MRESAGALRARLDGLYRVDQVIIDHEKRMRKFGEWELRHLMRLMLQGGEVELLGVKVALSVTLPDDSRLSREQMLAMLPEIELRP